MGDHPPVSDFASDFDHTDDVYAADPFPIPIIEAMQMQAGEPRAERRAKILWTGNLALTNITVADVILHHGGGITRDACPSDPAGCWAAWWQRNRGFRVKDIRQSRWYTNYPNYGIYRNLGRPKRP